MSTGAPATGGGRLGERLVEAGVATSLQVERALAAQRSVRGRLGYHLVTTAGVEPGALSDFLDGELEQGRQPGPGDAADPAVLATVPPRIAHVYNVYPLA